MCSFRGSYRRWSSRSTRSHEGIGGPGKAFPHPSSDTSARSPRSGRGRWSRRSPILGNCMARGPGPAGCYTAGLVLLAVAVELSAVDGRGDAGVATEQLVEAGKVAEPHFLGHASDGERRVREQKHGALEADPEEVLAEGH